MADGHGAPIGTNGAAMDPRVQRMNAGRAEIREHPDAVRARIHRAQIITEMVRLKNASTCTRAV